tara:strand:+ start:19564 stop:19995 length:432 start_codon:yes stop_codon:yes gene_type:complete
MKPDLDFSNFEIKILNQKELEKFAPAIKLAHGISELKKKMIADYEDNTGFQSSPELKKKRDDEYKNGIEVKHGRKYIRISFTFAGGHKSIWGFIVKTQDDSKFKFGDILYPNGCNSPARNKRRGNVVENWLPSIRWTGPALLI